MADNETPIKPGYRTTEFWVNVALQIVGFSALIYPQFITPERQSVLMQAITQLGGLITMVGAAFGYSLSRGLAKKK